MLQLRALQWNPIVTLRPDISEQSLQNIGNPSGSLTLRRVFPESLDRRAHITSKAVMARTFAAAKPRRALFDWDDEKALPRLARSIASPTTLDHRPEVGLSLAVKMAIPLAISRMPKSWIACEFFKLSPATAATRLGARHSAKPSPMLNQANPRVSLFVVLPFETLYDIVLAPRVSGRYRLAPVVVRNSLDFQSGYDSFPYLASSSNSILVLQIARDSFCYSKAPSIVQKDREGPTARIAQ